MTCDWFYDLQVVQTAYTSYVVAPLQYLIVLFIVSECCVKERM